MCILYSNGEETNDFVTVLILNKATIVPHSKKKLFSRTPQKGSVDIKKLPDELKCRKKQFKKSTKP